MITQLQQLRTDLVWSVGVTTAIQLVWLNRFTDTQPSHLPQQPCNQKDNYLFINLKVTIDRIWQWIKRYKWYNKEVLSPSIIITEEHFVRIFEDGEGWDFGSPKHVEDLLGVVLGDFRTPLDGDWTSSSTTFFRVLLSRPLPFGGMTKMNKRPKGPHIMHLSTMCNLFEESARAAILFFRLARKIQTW